MSEWKKVKLGEISLNIQTGPFGSQLHQSDYVDTGVPVIMPKDIINGKICDDTIARISSDLSCKLLKYQVEFEDIIYPRRGDISKCAIVDKSQKGWLCGTGCLKISIDKSLAKSKFIYYELQLPKQIGWIINHAIGATMLNLNTNILQNVPIDLPSINTQNRIVGILSRYDSLIENYQKQIKLLEESAQRLYKEWFVDLRFPGHENTKIVDGVPEGWEKKQINDICSLITSGGTPSRNNKSFWDNGNIKWVKTKELNDTWIIDTEEHITETGLNNSSAKIFPPNTILMAIYASPTLGRLGILVHEACCNQAALGFIPNEFVSWQWLFYKLYELRDKFNSIARGAGQQNISAIVVKETAIVVPEKNIIDKYTSLVTEIFNRQRTIIGEIKLLTEAHDRLLPKLMDPDFFYLKII